MNLTIMDFWNVCWFWDSLFETVSSILNHIWMEGKTNVVEQKGKKMLSKANNAFVFQRTSYSFQHCY